MKEDHNGWAVSEILRYRQKKLTILYYRISIFTLNPKKTRLTWYIYILIYYHDYLGPNPKRVWLISQSIYYHCFPLVIILTYDREYVVNFICFFSQVYLLERNIEKNYVEREKGNRKRRNYSKQNIKQKGKETLWAKVT